MSRFSFLCLASLNSQEIPYSSYHMDWWGSIFRDKRPNIKNSPFFKSLRFNNNHLSQKEISTKLISFRKIHNFITKSFIYRCQLEFFQNKEVLVCCQAFIEPHSPIRGPSVFTTYSILPLPSPATELPALRFMYPTNLTTLKQET